MAKAKRITENSDSKRGKNKKSLANLQPFPKGVSGNPGGRPKLLGESYRAELAKLTDEGITNAEALARSMVTQAIMGDVGAAKELRSATEGDKVTLATWQTEIVEALKAGKLTAQQVIDELGNEDARAILIASGTPFLPGAQSASPDRRA